MRITSKQLRQIIREELDRMNEGRRGGRHGMDYGYGSFGGGSQGGHDEGWDEPEEGGWGSGPSARDLGWKVGDTVKGSGKTGTVTKVSEWDTGVSVEWDDGSTGEYDGKYLKKGR